MKRLLLLVAVAVFGVSAAVRAQQVKFDAEGALKKIAKFESDSQDPKKGAKATTWIELGKAYENAASGAVNGLYRGLDSMTTSLVFQKPERGTETVDGVEFVKWAYPDFDVYLKDGIVYFWKPKTTVVEGALDKAAAAFQKAYELDNSLAEKVAEGLMKVVNDYKQDADNFYSLSEYGPTAKAFAAAYDLQRHPSINTIDTASCFNAGYMYTLDKNFEQGEKYLKDAIANGYESEGDAYYFLFHCYYGQKKMDDAKQILLTGVSKYPKNTRIVEGLIELYIERGEDPHAIIPYVQQGIDSDPSNPKLWSGLGRVYEKLGDSENATKAFAKVVELSPDSFDANYNYALMLIRATDNMTTEFNNKTFTSREERDAEMKKLNDAYASALAPLEKAHTANPNDAITIELLKSLYFRLRDESPAMMENYNKYNELFKNLPQ